MAAEQGWFCALQQVGMPYALCGCIGDRMDRLQALVALAPW
jgi:hypothetical protein